jgi:F-type H+-transporting ATPase subunit delta
VRAQEVVRRYASTLLDAATETGVSEEALRVDLEGLAATLNASEELTEFVENRLLQPAVKRAGLEAVFSGKVQPLTLNFLRLLADRRRVPLLPAIAVSALEVLDGRSGIATAQVRSASALTEEQMQSLRSRLAAYTGRQIRLDAQVDESLRGGLVASVGDLVFDGTVETQLERLRHRFLTG